MIKAAVAGRETIPYEDSNARYKIINIRHCVIDGHKESIIKVHCCLIITVQSSNGSKTRSSSSRTVLEHHRCFMYIHCTCTLFGAYSARGPQR
jgi:hypothetical protein